MFKMALFCFLTFCAFSQSHEPPKAVTYTFSGGRFGDNLLSYLHAKWIAYQYQIPLLYRPFNYSQYLVLDDRELKYVASSAQLYPRLYTSPYFPEDPHEYKNGLDANGVPWSGFEVNWKDPGFRKVVKEMIAPKNPLSPLPLLKII